MGTPRTPPWNTLRAVSTADTATADCKVEIGRRWSTFVGRDRENGGCGVGKCRCYCRRRHPARHAPRHTFGVTSRPIHEKTGARAHTTEYNNTIYLYNNCVRTTRTAGDDQRPRGRRPPPPGRMRALTILDRPRVRGELQQYSVLV